MLLDDRPDASTLHRGVKAMRPSFDETYHVVDRVIPTWAAEAVNTSIRIRAIGLDASHLVVSHGLNSLSLGLSNRLDLPPQKGHFVPTKRFRPPAIARS